MLGVGLWEILIVLAAALALLGPERCLRAAKRAGGLWGRAGRSVEELKRELDLTEDA